MSICSYDFTAIWYCWVAPTKDMWMHTLQPFAMMAEEAHCPEAAQGYPPKPCEPRLT